MINLIVFVLLLIYAGVITWKNDNMDDRWIRFCHTLGMSSRAPKNEVFDKLTTVMANSEILDDFMYDQNQNDFEEDDVETNSTVQE